MDRANLTMKFSSDERVTGVIEIVSLDPKGRPFGKFFYRVGEVVVGDPDDDAVDLFDCLGALQPTAHDAGSRDAASIRERDPGRLFQLLFEHTYGDAEEPATPWHKYNVTIECFPLESLFCYCCDFPEGSTFLCAEHTPTGYRTDSVRSVQIRRGALDRLIVNMQCYLMGVLDLFSKNQNAAVE